MRIRGSASLWIIGAVVAIALTVAFSMQTTTLMIEGGSGTESEAAEITASEGDAPVADAGAMCTLAAPMREEIAEDPEAGTAEVHDGLVAASPQAVIAAWARSSMKGDGADRADNALALAAERSSKARAIPLDRMPPETREMLENHPLGKRFQMWSTAENLQDPIAGDVSYLIVDDVTGAKLLSIEVAVRCDDETALP